MKPKRNIKKDSISITLDQKTIKMLKDETNNNSKFIERILLNYFYNIGRDTKNIIL